MLVHLEVKLYRIGHLYPKKAIEDHSFHTRTYYYWLIDFLHQCARKQIRKPGT